MGTRHLILVYYKGQYRIAQYGQWDGYPSGQGCTILAFLKDPEKLEKLKANLDKPGMLYKPSDTELDEIYERINEAWQAHFRVDQRKLVDPDEIEKHCSEQPVIAEATEPLPIVSDIGFLSDKLMCEWAYVVDLDENVFEVFSSRGVNEDYTEKDRFTNEVEGLEKAAYFPPRQGFWKLDQLPKEKAFLSLFEDEEETEAL